MSGSATYTAAPSHDRIRCHNSVSRHNLIRIVQSPDQVPNLAKFREFAQFSERTSVADFVESSNFWAGRRSRFRGLGTAHRLQEKPGNEWTVPDSSEDELHRQLDLPRVAGFRVPGVSREQTAEVGVIRVVVELPPPVLVGVGEVERLEPELNAGSFGDPGRLVQ